MTDAKIEYCVKVTNAFKSYGNNSVFKGLNMNVKSGCIYGLLGPSGCGKSTLLQCILGTISLDSGHIDFAAENLKDIGYMPQDLCLEGLLTVKEAFEYYGALYKVSKKNIKNRVKELEEILELPNLNCYIKNISGGQARRVSLGISLIHDPKVIILDEPTVGIDPLLREKIWAELTKMVEQQQKTIIITTHYIDEANQADCIGLVRNGVLVEEGSPQYILSKYNTESLESAFLTICADQETNQLVHETTQETDNRQSKNLMKNNEEIKFHRIKTLLRKNGRVLYRDYWLMFSVMILPIFQSMFLLSGVGGDFKGLEIAVNNEEINNLVDCRYTNVSGCIFDENNKQTQSCLAMNYLESLGYKLIEMEDQRPGDINIENTKYVGFVYFPKNYTTNLITYFDDINNYNVQPEAFVDYARNNYIYKMKFLKDMIRAMKHLIRNTLISCSNNPRAVASPMGVDTLVGQNVKFYIDSITAAFLGMGAFYFISMYSVTTMMSEKMDGFFCRSVFAGVTITELMISMFCIANVLTVLHLIFPVINTYVFFSTPIILTKGLIMYAILLILLGWQGFLFGLLTAGIIPNKAIGIALMNGVGMAQFLLTGGIWPVEGQPLILKTISNLLPMTIACKTLNDISLKGWTWNNPSVIAATAATFAYDVLISLIIIVLVRFKRNMWVLPK